MSPPSTQIVNLNISELIVTAEPVVLCTVLGSCVSVCLFSPSHKAGGMIHYALPEASDPLTEEKLRYGNFAIPTLIEELQSLTHDVPTNFVAKLIGGADNIRNPTTSMDVGTHNIAIARELLKKFGIKIIGEDVGGNHGRKALFHVTTGRLQSAFVGPGFNRPSASKAILQ